MATVTLIRDRPDNGSRLFAGFSGKRAYLYTEDGAHSFSFDIAPREGTFSDMADDWVTTERPQDLPLLQRKGRKLPVFKATATLADKYDPLATQITQLANFYAVTKSDMRILFRYGLTETGLWRVTEASYDIKRRHPVNSDPTQVEVSFTLTRASNPGDATMGPSSGYATTLAPSQVSGSRSHVLVAGETLYQVAARYYGSGSLWVQIYDANRNVLDLPYGFNPGTRLIIP